MSTSRASVVGVALCTGNDGKWSVCVYVPTSGLYVVSEDFRTKAEAMTMFRLVRDHLRSTMRVAMFAAAEATTAIAKAKGEQ